MSEIPIPQRGYEAIRAGDLPTIRELLANDREVFTENTVIGNSLHDASRAGHLEVVEFLVGSGVDPLFEAESAGTPLGHAVSEGHFVIADYLLKLGARFSTGRPNHNELFTAITTRNLEAIRYLFDRGIDPHVAYRGRSGQLRNALTYAEERGEQDIAVLLRDAGCRVPVEGVDLPVWEPEEYRNRLLASPTPARDQIIEHMAENYGPVDTLSQQEILPVLDDVHISLHAIRPTDDHPFLTLFTVGMSDRPMQVPTGQEEFQFAELVIHLPPDWPHPSDPSADSSTLWPCEWLRRLAYFPHQHETWLGGQTTIISSAEPPVPLGPNTAQTCLLLLADFPHGMPLPLDNGNFVRLYTVVPLHTAERDFEKANGIVPLLERLQAQGSVAEVDVNRPSAIPESA